MEAGYDYLLINRRGFLQRLSRSIGQNPLLYSIGALVIMGVIGAVVASLVLFVFSGSTDDVAPDVVATPVPTPAIEAPTPQVTPTPAPTPALAPVEPAPAPPVAVSELSSDLAREAILFPGNALKASHWAELAAFVPTAGDICTPGDPDCEWSVPQGVSALGQLPAPTRLIIPSIDVDSDVMQLRILDLGNYRQYETPNNVVGHIPESANPGETGSTWLFGHLESPIRDEGNVFAQLPEIPAMLRRGDEVFAVMENGTESYLYRIIDSRVVPQAQLSLNYESSPQLLMVTPVPRNVYDHRLIVRGELVGVKS